MSRTYVTEEKLSMVANTKELIQMDSKQYIQWFGSHRAVVIIQPGPTRSKYHLLSSQGGKEVSKWEGKGGILLLYSICESLSGLELWHIWYGPTNLLILRMKSWVSVGNISLIFAVPHREGQKTDIVLILYRGHQVWIKWLAKTPFPQIIICSHIWANKPQLLILKLELFVEESSLYRTENMTSTRVLCFLFVKWCSTPGLCCHRQFPVSGIKTYCCLNMENTQGSTKTSEIKRPSSFEGLKLLITHFPLIYIFFFQIPIQTPELWSSIWESQRAYSKAKRK